MTQGGEFTDEWRVAAGAALEAAVPGSVELGALDYVMNLLSALDHDPPRIWAAPAGTGARWLDLGPWERHAWRIRLARWREAYERVADGSATHDDLAVVHEHACEATYGDPAYGGNRGSGGWHRIGFPEPLHPPARSDAK